MPNSSETYAPDDTTVYETMGQILKVGRSIAIDLLDAGVCDCQVPDPHVTIFFRKGKDWTQRELEIVREKREEYLTNHSKITFTTQGWGPNSKLIVGDSFHDYARFLLSSFKEWHQDRPLHVTLRTRGKGKGKGLK